MILRRGGVHPLELLDHDGERVSTRATHVVVISEDAWNIAMNSAVAVPVVPGEPMVDLFHIPVDGMGYADVSIVQSVRYADLGDEVLAVDPAPIAAAAAAYLDLDDLEHRRIRRSPVMVRDEPRAQQKSIHWTDLGLDERKRVLVMSPDERNGTAAYVTALYVTSRDKRRRRPWQVPAAGGWVITGDVLLCTHRSLGHRRRPTPSRATVDEMAEVARALRHLLSG